MSQDTGREKLTTETIPFLEKHILQLDVRTLLVTLRICLSPPSSYLSCYTTVGVLCVIKILYNSHFSLFFLLAALLLSVALSVEELIRTVAEIMQRSWGLGASQWLSLYVSSCVYIKCVRFGFIDVELVAYHLRMTARAVFVTFVLPLLSAKLT